MSNVLDPSLCIVSRCGVYYWRPETGSRWRGDPDDRTWVPALDWPPNTPVPPDPQASAPGQTEQSPPRQRQRPGNRRLRGNQREEEIARTRTSRCAATHARTSRRASTRAARHRGDPISPADTTLMRIPTASLVSRNLMVGTATGSTAVTSETVVTKPRKPSIAVMCPVPLVDNAAVDAEGYPVFPLSAPTDDDASDYGGSEADDSGSDGARARQDIMNKERARLEDAHGNRGARPTPAELLLPPVAAGIWGSLRFDSVERAKLLTQWWRAGCPKADIMVKHIVRLYGQYPLLRRSVETLYLMRHMREGSAAYLFAATGDPTPISRRNSRMPVPRNMRREFAAARRAGSSSTTTLSTSGTGPSGDEPMPAAPSAPAPYTHDLTQLYIGFSPAPEGEHTDRMGPQAVLRDVIAHLEQMPPARWARGIRDDSGFWPAPEAPAGISPHVGDLMASRLIHFLSPARDAGGTSIHHSRWRGMVLNAFAVPGLYERHVGIGGWIGAFAPLERYPFDTLNMSLSEALQWVHTHGVPADSDASRVLHDYAASWRNSREDSGDSCNVDFPGDYPSPASAWPADRITRWAQIRHGMLRVGARSVYPQSPGTTPAAPAPVPEGEDSEMAVVHPAEEGELQDGSGAGSASVTQGGA
ncbi:hypothetical protein K438DRAFT_1783785 [Mycena galopus ATCC 62051]|nr:hypothetical protein K438DRAFT_1783785 [Mycena galopus ATCC 62051]